jgi:hypothetical protein
MFSKTVNISIFSSTVANVMFTNVMFSSTVSMFRISVTNVIFIR